MPEPAELPARVVAVVVILVVAEAPSSSAATLLFLLLFFLVHHLEVLHGRHRHRQLLRVVAVEELLLLNN